jgi:hypothetical protein
MTIEKISRMSISLFKTCHTSLNLSCLFTFMNKHINVLIVSKGGLLPSSHGSVLY